MKRLIYATAVLILAITLTVYSHFAVNSATKKTIDDINKFCDQKITSEKLVSNWKQRKENMSAFVNHDFLDQISLYIGQITLGDSSEDENFVTAYQNIMTLLSMIQDEQRLAPHSFY